jgi:hypothetical protein
MFPLVLLLTVDAKGLMRRLKPLAPGTGTNTGKDADVKAVVADHAGERAGEQDQAGELVQVTDARSKALSGGTAGYGATGAGTLTLNHINQNLADCNSSVSEETCPDDCAWFPDVGACVSQINPVYVSGIDNVEEWIDDKFAVWRPQFITRMHRDSSSSQWFACSGNSSCFFGTRKNGGKREKDARLVGELSDNDIDRIAIEMHIHCEGAAKVKVNLGCGTWSQKNAEVHLWYNLEPVSFQPCGANERVRRVKISVDPSDAHPILRIEAKRANSSIQFARQTVYVSVPKVPATYDACMEFHTHHGQCVEEMAGSLDVPLRTNHTLQYDCLLSNDDSINRCAEWQACLNGTDGFDTLVTVLEAFSMTPNSLLQVTGQPASPRHGQENHLYANCTCTDDANHETCVDPETMDLQAFDCDCAEELKSMNATEIHDQVCARADICCDWKATHCATTCTPITSTLLEDHNTLITKRSTSTQNIKLSGDESTSDLDKAVLGKCTSD